MSTLHTVWICFLGFFLGGYISMAQKQPLSPPLPQPPFEIRFDSHQHYTALKMNQKTIDSVAIGTFNARPGKGQVRQSFQNAVLSGSPSVYPFEYQYYVCPSPDKKRYLIYRYDYSQSTLFAHLKLVDMKGNVQATIQLPVDNGLTNHGYWVDNLGYVYTIQTDAEEAIFVMRYTDAATEPDWLEIGADAMRRNRFMPFFEENQRVAVAAIVEDDHAQWKGVLIGTFDFLHKRLHDVSLYSPSPKVQKSGEKLSTGRYELLDFQIREGQKTLTLQKAAILANKYIYNPYAVLSPQDWAMRKQRVQYSEKIQVQMTQTGHVTEHLEATSQAR